ncbi:MAG: hypothetical protein AAF236_09890 [Verrucomicrobiota bacterium]
MNLDTILCIKSHAPLVDDTISLQITRYIIGAYVRPVLNIGNGAVQLTFQSAPDRSPDGSLIVLATPQRSKVIVHRYWGAIEEAARTSQVLGRVKSANATFTGSSPSLSMTCTRSDGSEITLSICEVDRAEPCVPVEARRRRATLPDQSEAIARPVFREIPPRRQDDLQALAN